MYARMINTKRINDSIGHYIHESNKHQNYWNIYMFVFVLLLGPSMVENGFSIMKNFKKRILKSFTCQLTNVIRPCNVRAIEVQRVKVWVSRIFWGGEGELWIFSKALHHLPLHFVLSIWDYLWIFWFLDLCTPKSL